jgi:hypothetical protein
MTWRNIVRPLTNFFTPCTNIQIVISDFEVEVETKDVEPKAFQPIEH